MYKTSCYIFILLFLLPLLSDAQSPQSDSLRNKYVNEKNDSLKIKYHLKYIYTLLQEQRQNESAAEIVLVKEELKKSPVASLVPVLFFYEGELSYDRTEYLQSVISYERSLKTYRSESENDNYNFTAGNVYVSLGLSYSMINDWENAQLNYQYAIREYQKINDSSGTALGYLNIAYIFSDVNDWMNAGVNLTRSANYLNANSNKYYQVVINASLSEAYSRLDKLNESKIYLEKCDSLIHLFPDADGKTFYFIAKGEYALSTKNYSEALDAGLNSLEYARKWGDSAFVAKAFENIGRAYEALGKYDEAVFCFTQSSDLAVKYNYMPQRKTTLKQLFQLYNENGESQKAAMVARELFNISDSLAIVQNNNRRIIMDAVFESENKEKRITVLTQERELQQLRLNQKNIFNYILMGGIITLLAISVLSYRNYKQKQKLQQQRISELEKDKQLVAVDSMLKGQEDERLRLAKDLHDGLGGILSGVKFSLVNMKSNLSISKENAVVFERSLDMLDTSIAELRRVAYNMMPETLIKFGLDEAMKDYCNDLNSAQILNIQYQSFGMEQKLESRTEIIIYRIIQELLNNIFKHAKATEVLVQLVRGEKRLSVTVEDNGKGFNVRDLEKAKGAGWSNIRSRIDYLKGKLDLHSEPGNGTSVNIEIHA